MSVFMLICEDVLMQMVCWIDTWMAVWLVSVQPELDSACLSGSSSYQRITKRTLSFSYSSVRKHEGVCGAAVLRGIKVCTAQTHRRKVIFFLTWQAEVKLPQYSSLWANFGQFKLKMFGLFKAIDWSLLQSKQPHRELHVMWFKHEFKNC